MPRVGIDYVENGCKGNVTLFSCEIALDFFALSVYTIIKSRFTKSRLDKREALQCLSAESRNYNF